MTKLFKPTAKSYLIIAILIALLAATVPVLADNFDQYGKHLPVPAGAEVIMTWTPQDHMNGSFPHWAQDFVCLSGYPHSCITNLTSATSVSDGVISQVVYDNSGYGNRITIDHGNGIWTRYNHLDMMVFTPADIGRSIRRGQQLGLIGATGNVTGPNLELGFFNNAQVLNSQSVKSQYDGRVVQGGVKNCLSCSWYSPVPNFDMGRNSHFWSYNSVRPDDLYGFNPPVIDPLDRLLHNYGYLFPSGMIAEPVNTATGAFVHRNVDLDLAVEPDELGQINGLQLELERFYNSPDQFQGLFGKGWASNLDLKVMAHDDFTYSVRLADGRGETFVETDTDRTTFTATFTNQTPESKAILTRYDQSNSYKFLYTASDQTKYLFYGERTDNKWGKVQQISRPDGGYLDFFYDSNAKLTQVRDHIGRSIYFTIGTNNLVNSVTDSAGRTVSYSYNFDGRLQTVTKANGGIWTYSYDGQGRILTITDAENKLFVTNVYDSAGRVISQTDAKGGITTFAYSDELNLLGQPTGNKITDITDPLTNVTRHIHNTNYYLIREVAGNGDTTSYEYNAKGLVTKKILPGNVIYLYEYDAQGNQTKETKPNGYIRTTTYNTFARPLTITDPTGTITNTYNAQTKLTKTVDQLNHTTNYYYNAAAQLIGKQDANLNTTGYQYNPQGLLAKTTAGYIENYYIHNPAQAQRSWLFVNGSQGWEAANHIEKIMRLNSATVYTVTGSDPYIYGPVTSLPTTSNRYVILDMASGSGNANCAQIFFRKSGQPSFLGNQQVTFTITNDGTRRRYIIDMAQNAEWYGTIDRFRLDPSCSRPSTTNNEVQFAQFTVVASIPAAEPTTISKLSHDYNAAAQRIKTTASDSSFTTFSYTSLGKLASTTDPRGNTKSFQFDLNGNLRQETDELGKITSYQSDGNENVTQTTYADATTLIRTYDGNNNKLTETDRRGQLTGFVYDAKNRLIEQHNPDSSVVKFEYDALGRKTKEIDGRNNATTFTYDSVGNLLTRTNALGQQTQFSYDTSSRLTQVKDAENNITKYEYNALGQRTKEIDALNKETIYTYDNVGNNITRLDALNNLTQYFYNSDHKLVGITSAKGDQATYSYNLKGQLTSQTNFAGETTAFAYDASDNLISQTDELNNQISFDYTARNELKKVTDQRGNHTNYTFDDVGRQVQEVNALSNTVSYQYDGNGNLVKYTGENGSFVTYSYDGLNRETLATDQRLGELKHEYDAAGNITKIIDKNGGQTLFTYDNANRLIKQTNALNQDTLFEYSANGNLVKVTNPLSQVEEYTYDKLNRQLTYKDAAGTVHSTTYDALGQPTAVTDGKGVQTLFEYNAVGNLTKVTDRLGKQTTYNYDGAGRITATHKPLNVTETKQYDATGRLSVEINGENGQTSYSYDAAGNVTAITSPRGTITTFEYDALGRQTKTIDPNNVQTTTTYDSVGRVWKQTDGNGKVTEYNYNPTNQVTKIINGRGFATDFSYDAQGNLVAVANPRSQVTQFYYDALNREFKRKLPGGSEQLKEYNAAGQLTKFTDQRGGVNIYTYDSRGNLLTEKDPGNFTASYNYDLNNNLTTSTDKAGSVSSYFYSANDQLTKITNALNKNQLFSYDDLGRLISETNERGAVTGYSYDKLNRLVTATDALSNATTREYNANGRLTKQTDASGKVTTFEYDNGERQTKAINANGKFRQFNYDGAGNVLWTKDENGFTTWFAYDGVNNNTKRTDPTGNFTQYLYDSNNNLVKEIDARANSTIYAYDPLDNMIKKTMPGGEEFKYQYDTAGNTTKYTTPKGHNYLFAYDSRNLLTTKTDPLGNVESFEYDSLGRLTKHKDALQKPTTYQYDTLSRLTKVIDALNQETTYAYDEVGNLVQELNARSKATNYEYDVLNRQTKETNPLGKIWTKTYNPVGTLASSTDPNGTTTSYSYDNLHRLSSVNVGVTAQNVAYSYDFVGNITQIANGNVTNSYTYNQLNQLTKATDSRGKEINYTYDTVGNRTQVKYPDQRTADYAYNSNNLVQSLSVKYTGDAISSTNPYTATTTFSYDQNLNLTKQSNSNNTEITQAFDNANRLTAVVNKVKNSTTNAWEDTANFSYQLNGNGDKVTETVMQKIADGNGTLNLTAVVKNYEYDVARQLTKVTAQRNNSGNLNALVADYIEQYQYDPTGNRTQLDRSGVVTSYTYNDANQLTEDSSYTYSYDYNGNRLTKTGKTNGLFTNASYDKLNNLVHIDSKLDANTTFNYDYQYDGLGRRTAKVNNTSYTQPAAGQGISRQDYFYDGHNLDVVSEYFDRSGDTDIHSNMYTANVGAATPTLIAQDDILERSSNAIDLALPPDADTGLVADKVVVVQPATNELPNNETEAPSYTLAVKCVIWHTDETYTAYFSYQNNLATNQPLTISSLSAGSGTAPQKLFPGVHEGAFTVNAARGLSIAWSTSATTNGVTLGKTATASDAATRCNTPADINWLISPDSVQRLSYTQRDGLGSIVGKTDLSVKYQAQRVSGSVSVSNTPVVQQATTYATNVYNAYGTGSRNETPYSPEASGNNRWASTTYSGKQYDPETGFNNYGSRYYDPSNATWNKQDSYRGEVNNPITRNRYAFVNNNPVNMVDAYGYSAVSPTGMSSAIAAASQALQSLQNTRSNVASQQANLISQKNKLQSQLPGLAANMNNAYWSAKLAGDYSRLNYQMQFVVSRLEARGYEMNYAVVKPYIDGRVVQTQQEHQRKQAQYNSAKNAYYGTVNSVNNLANGINSLGNTIRNIDNSINVGNKAIGNASTAFSGSSAAVAGFASVQTVNPISNILAAAITFATPIAASNGNSQHVDPFSGGRNILNNQLSPAGLWLGATAMTSEFLTDIVLGVSELASFTLGPVIGIRTQGWQQGYDPVYDFFQGIRNDRSRFLSTTLGVGDEDYYFDGTTILDSLFPGITNAGNLFSDKYTPLEKGYLAGKVAVDVANIVISVKGIAEISRGVSRYVTGGLPKSSISLSLLPEETINNNPVIESISQTGKLPTNYITKQQAIESGWIPSKGNLNEVAPGKLIGGDVFYNRENILPNTAGRIWREADISYQNGFRGPERILYSNDGLIYISKDHYATKPIRIK